MYDGVPHASLRRHAELAARAFIVSSFGKTYHVTGWKVGYVAAPASLMAQFRKVHQYNVFSVNTPMQHGFAAYMTSPAHYLELPAFYQHKRDLFRAGLAGSRFELLPADGTYFQCVKYAAISQDSEAQFAEWLTTELKVAERQLDEAAFCQWLTAEVGVAAIPLSAFYGDGFAQHTIRFCFAKQDATLASALERLARL